MLKLVGMAVSASCVVVPEEEGKTIGVEELGIVYRCPQVNAWGYFQRLRHTYLSIREANDYGPHRLNAVDYSAGPSLTRTANLEANVQIDRCPSQHPRLGLAPAGADRDVESHPRLRSTSKRDGLRAAGPREMAAGGGGGTQLKAPLMGS